MLSAGWSYKLVLLLQFLAQVTAFIGLYIGIALSNAFEDAQIWIFSIAAGMFLYVALCDAVCFRSYLSNHKVEFMHIYEVSDFLSNNNSII